MSIILDQPDLLFKRPEKARGSRAQRAKTRQRLLDGGCAPAQFHRDHGRSFLRELWHAEGEHRGGHARCDAKGGIGRGNLHALGRRKTAHLPRPYIYWFFCARTLLAYLSCVVRLPGRSLNVT